MKRPLLCATVSLCLLSLPVRADWRSISKNEMICDAQAIAIVTIGSIKPSHIKSGSRMIAYPQMASATVEEVIKGNIPRIITIYGGRNTGSFMCYPGAYLVSGRCIVFLTNDGMFQVPINADLGIRTISNEQLEWFQTDKDSSSLQRAKVSEVVTDIKTQLEKCPKELRRPTGGL